tara:strand:+ start:369 stop:659 length:291 start_codon:yes stop_codon:yes gene_type:complete
MDYGKPLTIIIIDTFWFLLFSAVIGLVIVGAYIDHNNPTFKKIGTIKCYSGNTLTYEGKTTGVIRYISSSDNYQFRELGTDNFMEVSGNCIIKYDN